MSRLTKFCRAWYLRRVIEYEETPLDAYVEGLARDEPYSFARYGDGEWCAVLGDPGRNADLHEYFLDLGRELRAALDVPLPYRYGMQPSVMGEDGVRIGRYIRRHAVRVGWHDADVFHDANREGRLFPLVEQLRRAQVVVVGPPHLRAVDRALFPWVHFIEVPAVNCWLRRDETERAILEFARDRTRIVYAFAASMMTNVLVHALFPRLGRENWMIDFGSLWDVYVGVQSRGVYRELDWEPIIARNLNG